jgi:hypothetical protein
MYFPLCLRTHLPERQGTNVLPVYDNATAGQVDHSEQSHQQRRLSRASAPHDADLRGCQAA